MSVKSDYREIYGSNEHFNRVLYGGHENDDTQDRFFTFAGDVPLFLGALSDYTKDTWCYQAKQGTLMSGVSLTPGFAESPVKDSTSGWFHKAMDIHTKWNHGYMSYDLNNINNHFPDIRVHMEVYPLNPDDGFLVHYEIRPQSRMVFCVGFGGITDFFGRFEYRFSARKEFAQIDCENNEVQLFHDGAMLAKGEMKQWISCDFDCSYSTDSGIAMEQGNPGYFLKQWDENAKQIVKIQKVLLPGEVFRGNIIVAHNGDRETAKKYFSMKDPCSFLRGKIREKFAGITFSTPDEYMDSSFKDTIIGLDAAFHGKSFYHGAIGYHAPFLGWRGWYAPTLLGWKDRVRSAVTSHFDTIKNADGVERVWWDGGDRPDLDHEGTQYHHIENSSGYLTALLYRDDIYDMQEVAVDMTLHYLEHSGDMETCELIYDRLCRVLDWEERILDPEHKGLYQNFLNTWISDGHSYNGAYCAQATSYNYRANVCTAKLGKVLGRDVSALETRIARIKKAYQDVIWQEKQGVPAESVDTIGNKLVHDHPELSTLYLASECENTDPQQTYRMLQFAKRYIPQITTAGDRQGTIYFSADWHPKKYSTSGIFPAENAALALAFFKNGQRTEAMKIVNGLLDGFQLSPHPGSITHVFTANGGSECGDIDFTDVTSCYLRMLIEGLWGIRFVRCDNKVYISPELPDEWKQATLTLSDINLNITRNELLDTIQVSGIKGKITQALHIPLRKAGIDQVFLNGKEIFDYTVQSGWERSYLALDLENTGSVVTLEIYYMDKAYPVLEQQEIATFAGNTEMFRINSGCITGITAPDNIIILPQGGTNARMLKISGEPGYYDCFVKVETKEGITVELPLAIKIQAEITADIPLAVTNVEHVDISGKFNSALTTIHEQDFVSPRPAGYSIGMRKNGRYAWEWNHFGHNGLNVDDSILRNSKGVYTSPSGITFATPENGNNAACVSIWDNFPTTMTFPVSGKASEMAILLSGTTFAMQAYVVNFRLTVRYKDGTETVSELIHPVNFDDFLVPALQTADEVCYFSDRTHGQIHRIKLDPAKELESLTTEAVANETILDVLAISLLK